MKIKDHGNSSYKGKLLKDMTKRELLQVINEIGNLYSKSLKSKIENNKFCQSKNMNNYKQGE